MNPRFRSALLLLVTLVIGMILGALIHSSVRDHRMKRGAGFMRSEENFVQSFEKTIGPVDEQQAEEIRVVLTEAAPGVISQWKANQTEIRSQLDVMQEKLSPILDEDQLERLQNRFSRRRHRDAQRDDNQ
jgi:hypothetical protein